MGIRLRLLFDFAVTHDLPGCQDGIDVQNIMTCVYSGEVGSLCSRRRQEKR